MKNYLFILGRNTELSRAELTQFCKEVVFDKEKSLLIGTNLHFTNPRNIPRTPEQLFLDRLGGTIRFAEITGEFFSETELKNQIIKQIQKDKKEGKIHLGISGWGVKSSFTKSMLSQLKNEFKEQHSRNCRIININGKALDSGTIFGEKLLRKGFEFIIWKKKNSYLLAQTVANQNLRNYTLRDHDKPWRDNKMGMLPPKLAQILINLTNPQEHDTIIDPFCGSGTINIEAAIMGFHTIGSDKSSKHVEKTKENFEYLAEKFRYLPDNGTFFASDARDIEWEKLSGVIATEGFLGENSGKMVSPDTIKKEEATILRLWEDIFEKLENTSIQKIALCLPAWKTKGKTHSLSQKLFAKIAKSSYTPLALFNGEKTFLYARPDAFVMREICVLEKQK